MKGTYLLEIKVKKPCWIKIGSIGERFFGKGTYVYVGSALNNLEKRIERHFRKKKKKFWHVDYLLSNKNTELKRAFFIESKKKMECIIAGKMAKRFSGIKGFGCSDCSCESHLFKAKVKAHEFNFREWK